MYGRVCPSRFLRQYLTFATPLAQRPQWPPASPSMTVCTVISVLAALLRLWNDGTWVVVDNRFGILSLRTEVRILYILPGICIEGHPPTLWRTRFAYHFLYSHSLEFFCSYRRYTSSLDNICNFWSSRVPSLFPRSCPSLRN